MSELDYIRMLEDSLNKKIDLLRQLQVLNDEQRRILEDNTSSPDEFEDNINNKAEIIEMLDTMDSGFVSIYDKIKEELDANKEQYQEAIARMQDSIRLITDLSVDLQVQEARNKEVAKNRFAFVRKQIKEVKKGSEAVTSYYKNMNAFPGMDSQFLDRKK